MRGAAFDHQIWWCRTPRTLLDSEAASPGPQREVPLTATHFKGGRTRTGK
ncbi:hypothetical protein AB0I84_46605 [Streptomyces spectabilis]